MDIYKPLAVLKMSKLPLADRYFVLNKPYNMVSQFVSSHEVPLLTELDFKFPEGTHAIGRLDINSEGLLLLTTNKKITRLLFDGRKHERRYTVQVKKIVSDASLLRLQTGVDIIVQKGATYNTGFNKISRVGRPEYLPVIATEITGSYSSTWLQLVLTEGKFHQVRKMVAAIGHPCRRLVRTAIEDIELNALHLQPGEVLEMTELEFFKRLNLTAPKPPTCL